MIWIHVDILKVSNMLKLLYKIVAMDIIHPQAFFLLVWVRNSKAFVQLRATDILFITQVQRNASTPRLRRERKIYGSASPPHPQSTHLTRTAQ